MHSLQKLVKAKLDKEAVYKSKENEFNIRLE